MSPSPQIDETPSFMSAPRHFDNDKDIHSPQSLAPEIRCESIERAEQKSGDSERHKSCQESEGATGYPPRTGWRECSKQSEGRK
jgi:hypothetical protein